MSEDKVTLRRVSDAIEAILGEKFPAVEWVQATLGPVFPKVLTGFICCDEIIYAPQTKLNPVTTAYFIIEIICPNPVREAADNEVEDLATAVREALSENDNLDGWAESSMVNRIQFGTPAGNASIGAALMELEVKFIEE